MRDFIIKFICKKIGYILIPSRENILVLKDGNILISEKDFKESIDTRNKLDYRLKLRDTMLKECDNTFTSINDIVKKSNSKSSKSIVKVLERHKKIVKQHDNQYGSELDFGGLPMSKRQV